MLSHENLHRFALITLVLQSYMSKLIFSDPELLKEITKFSRVKSIKKDTVILSLGDDIVYLPIVQQGVLRIVRENEEGREIFLYHLYPGESCALAINCCQLQKKSLIKAIAEEDTELLMVPNNLVEGWFRYPQWRAFINNTYGKKFSELIDVIDLIAFSNMDRQVLHYLQERAKAIGSASLNITHHQIADELHTHREAISRLLRTMEQKGIVKLGRNSIELLG